MDLARIVLWLFVINLGIVFGAGLYEARIVVPLWASSPPESLRSPDSGRRFWAFVTTIPLTLLTLASLVAAWHAPAPRRESWLVAAVVILVERIATFSYFIPTMLRLQRAALPPADVRARVSLWARLNYLRSAITPGDSANPKPISENVAKFTVETRGPRPRRPGATGPGPVRTRRCPPEGRPSGPRARSRPPPVATPAPRRGRPPARSTPSCAPPGFRGAGRPESLR